MTYPYFPSEKERALSIEEDFRVIKIIDKFRIVVNKGYKHGLKKDDTLEIFTPGQIIIDPETREELGTLDNVKGSVEVEILYPRMAICKSDLWETKERTLNNFSSFVLGLPQTETTSVRKELPVENSQIEDLLDDQKIKVGDFLRLEIE